MNQSVFLVAFASVSGIGFARLRLLMEYFGTAEKAWEANEIQLRRGRLPAATIQELLLTRNKLIPQRYCDELYKMGIKFITILDKDYPESLKNISDPPIALFIKSNLDTASINRLTIQRIIAVVGTRKMTDYGCEVTSKLTKDLVLNGFTIVSGMALGVDGVAHKTAINNGGKTLAVLGTGVDVIYPREHTELYRNIIDSGGAVLSEVAPGRTVSRGMFPARNRIVSGLSEAVLVTEGAIDSGSLITARMALEQGREVFAVPGPINSPMAEGTNYLLKQGAKLVTKVDDILEELQTPITTINNGHT